VWQGPEEIAINKSNQESEQLSDIEPISAQQEQDEVVLAFLSNFPDASDASTKTSRPSCAASSKGLLELKKELQQKGMSDDEAEEFLRMV